MLWFPEGAHRVPGPRGSFLLVGLLWAFNPAGMKGKGFFRPREPIWMSRSTLLNKHAGKAHKGQVAEKV